MKKQLSLLAGALIASGFVFAADTSSAEDHRTLNASLARSEKTLAALAATVAKMEERVVQLVVQTKELVATPAPAAPAPRKSVESTPMEGFTLLRFVLGAALGGLAGAGIPHLLELRRKRRKGKERLVEAVQAVELAVAETGTAEVDLDAELAAPRIMQTEETDILSVAEAYASLGRPDTAIQLLRIELNEEPSNQAARQLLKRLLKQQAEHSVKANPHGSEASQARSA